MLLHSSPTGVLTRLVGRLGRRCGKAITRALEERRPPPRQMWSGCIVRIRILDMDPTSDPDDFQNLTGTFLFKVTFVLKFSR